MAETRKTFQIRQPQDVRYSGHGSGGFTASLEWDAGLAARLNGNEDEFVARKREFSILPDASGDGTDALQYSGSFGVKSEPVKGYAKVAADGKSCTFLEKPTVG